MKRIVLVEDEKVLADLLKKKLQEAGYDTTLVMNGADGLRAIQEIRPDLVLLDIVLPQMDGFAIMEELNKDQEVQKIPVIIVSNSGQPVEIERVKALGAKDWLIKTEFDPKEVVVKVQKQIG